MCCALFLRASRSALLKTRAAYDRIGASAKDGHDNRIITRGAPRCGAALKGKQVQILYELVTVIGLAGLLSGVGRRNDGHWRKLGRPRRRNASSQETCPAVGTGSNSRSRATDRTVTAHLMRLTVVSCASAQEILVCVCRIVVCGAACGT